ncbi:MAG: hypothetical protein KDJ36_15015 [Hyphomicrobiaceae bacterium]|nr:hypothetical protein [Hyphomicrobiaceae bacterium]
MELASVTDEGFPNILRANASGLFIGWMNGFEAGRHFEPIFVMYKKEWPGCGGVKPSPSGQLG